MTMRQEIGSGARASLDLEGPGLVTPVRTREDQTDRGFTLEECDRLQTARIESGTHWYRVIEVRDDGSCVVTRDEEGS